MSPRTRAYAALVAGYVVIVLLIAAIIIAAQHDSRAAAPRPAHSQQAP